MPSSHRFSSRCRLSDANAYRLVFRQSRKSVDPCFTVLWRSNSLERGRLGLAIAKKNLQRAVDRNRVKRIVRESFRLHQQYFAGIDIVVLSRRGAAPVDAEILRASLARHWLRIKESLVRAD